MLYDSHKKVGVQLCVHNEHRTTNITDLKNVERLSHLKKQHVYPSDSITINNFLYIFIGDCVLTEGARCQNGACLDHECHCNDGYGGCGCSTPGDQSFLFPFFSCLDFDLEKCWKRFVLNRCATSESFGNVVLIAFSHIQTKTSASIGLVTCSPSVPTPWEVLPVPATQVTKATVSHAQVSLLISFLVNGAVSFRESVSRE